MKRILRPIGLLLSRACAARRAAARACTRAARCAPSPTRGARARLVLLRRRHLDERLATRVLHSAIAVPVLRVEVADERLVDLAHPEHLAAARLDHLHHRVAVLAVLLADAAAAALNFSRLSITTGPSSGAFMSSRNCSLFGRMPLTCGAPFDERSIVRVTTRWARATLQPCAVRKPVPRVPARDEVERVERVGVDAGERATRAGVAAPGRAGRGCGRSSASRGPTAARRGARA